MPPSPAASTSASATARVVVGSVPTDHVYVDHLAPLDRPGPLRLPDPPGLDDDGVPTGHWWPHQWLRPDRADEAEMDLLHVHFGFEGRTPEQLAELVDALHDRGRALVVTVHDLRNPHVPDPAAHLARLGVLVEAADGLVTLTAGAAAEVEQRWGRRPVVVPHPHVVPLAELARRAGTRAPRPPGAPVRVGVDLKSLRPNTAAREVVPALVDAVGALARDAPGSTVQLAVHAAVLAPDAPRHDPEVVRLLEEAGRLPHVDVLVHDHLPDDALWDHLAALDVAVLPYRFGTHSGWLEACRDLGTDVVVPATGYYREQAPVDVFGLDDDGLDAASLADALAAVVARGSRGAVDVEERRAQREAVAAAYDAVYADALAARAHHQPPR